jgi:L-threonylcarbamoyladenylate synthase
MSDTPLTIIYPSARASSLLKTGLAQQVIATDGSVAIRVVQHPFCNALLKKFRKPIVSTSANYSGQPTPATFASIDPKLRKQADYCIDPVFAAPSTGKPSSIIKLGLYGDIKIIRP